MPKDPPGKKQSDYASSKKYFDIARPGNIPAPANARSGDINNTVVNDISGIKQAEHRMPFATDATEHLDMLQQKPRIVVQPAGTFNKPSPETITATAAAEPPAHDSDPDPLEEFDMASFPGVHTKEPEPAGFTTLHSAVSEGLSGDRAPAVTALPGHPADANDPPLQSLPSAGAAQHPSPGDHDLAAEPSHAAAAQSGASVAESLPSTAVIIDAQLPQEGVKLGRALTITAIVLAVLFIALMVVSRIVSFGS